MNPDELQQVWQSQTSGRRMSIDADVLLKQLQRNKEDFEATILWRDFREVGVALVMVPVWVWLGRRYDLPWTWYLCIPTLLWIAGFMIVDRLRQRRGEPKPGVPLRDCVERSLAQVEHQIRLLRSVFWWYLLPPSVAVGAFFAQCAWLARDGDWVVALVMTGVVTFAALVDWGIYWLNQAAVRDELGPRRRELQALLTSLVGTSTDGQLPEPSVAGSGSASRSVWRGVVQVLLTCSALAVLAHFIYGLGQENREAQKPAVIGTNGHAAGDAAVTNLLVAIRQKHDVPAISAALATSKGIEVVGVAGVRKRQTDVPATLDDLWHLGSDTKAMTATLVAKLVEQGRLKWETTVAEVFPELADKFHPDMRGVTLLHLLSHRSGLPPNLNLGKFLGDDVKQLRLRAVREELAKAPTHGPGSNYEYSNLGYIIVGAIVERITGKTWEEAIREEVCTPLNMTSIGFGGTGTRGQIDQPWPHHSDGKPMPENGPAMDNPPVMGPAGRVHCTIQDWAKFIRDQLRGARGEPALLSPASYQKLHTPPFGGDYALGWLVVKRDWGNGLVLNHAGDNTMNFANVWIAPQRDFAVLVCVNQSGDRGFKASDAAIGALIKFHADQNPEQSR
jgi:CubicO group peptidase (beta-lactamase class C family)